MDNRIFCVELKHLPKIASSKHATRCGVLPVIVLEKLAFGKRKVDVYWFDLNFIGRDVCHICTTIVDANDLLELSYESLKCRNLDEYTIKDLLKYEYGVYTHYTDAGLHRFCVTKNDGDVEEMGYYFCDELKGKTFLLDCNEKLLYKEKFTIPNEPTIHHRNEVLMHLIKKHNIKRIV